MSIHSEKLGSFRFLLKLNSKKNSNLPSINFKSKIGETSYKTFSFTNFIQKQIPFQISFKNIDQAETIKSSNDFSVSTNTVLATPAKDQNGSLQKLKIEFEPSFLGVSRSLISVENPEGGTFQAYLIGKSTLPLPKGPFKITGKG